MFKHCLIVFLVSMVPIIELRGAIPYGVGFGLPLWLTYIVAIVGNMLPVPLIYFFARRILEWGQDKPVIGKFFTFCLENGKKGGEKLQAKAGRGLFWALLLFVGIPLPGTGAWTGTLAASLLDMDFRKGSPRRGGTSCEVPPSASNQEPLLSRGERGFCCKPIEISAYQPHGSIFQPRPIW